MAGEANPSKPATATAAIKTLQTFIELSPFFNQSHNSTQILQWAQE
jgi:hypothetical protein